MNCKHCGLPIRYEANYKVPWIHECGFFQCSHATGEYDFNTRAEPFDNGADLLTMVQITGRGTRLDTQLPIPTKGRRFR